MITLQLRKLIIQKSFIAIKSLYGIQEKLKLEGYRNLKYDYDIMMSGVFFLRSEKGNYYKVKVEDYDCKITLLKRGKVQVTF
jgi:hypothetical protein